MSTLKVGTIANTSGGSGSTPEQIDKGRAKAWLNYDQINNNLRGSFNVSSITDNASGEFTVNFSASFSATDDYIPVGFVHRSNSAGRVLNHIDSLLSKTTSAYKVRTSSTTNGQVVGLSSFDSEYVQIAFFGDN